MKTRTESNGVRRILRTGMLATTLALSGCGNGADRLGQLVAGIRNPAVSNVMLPALVWTGDAPLVLYYDDSDASVYAAYPEGGSWTTELVETSESDTGVRGLHLEADTDAAGTVHAAYRDDDSGNVRYLTGTPGAWTAIEPLPAGENRGLGLDIAVDASGAPWIAYRNDSVQSLEVMIRQGDVWTVEEVDQEGNTGLWPALDFDLGGAAFVAYRNASESSVKLARYEAPGQWTLETVATEPGASIGTWLDIGVRPGAGDDLSLTFPRLIYLFERDAETTLHFAQPSDDGWSVGPVEKRLFGGTDNCLAVAANGDVWVSYFDAIALDLKVARYRDGKWRSTVVDDRGPTGFWTDCLIDPAGEFHVVYVGRDETGASIRHRVVTHVF